MNVVNFHYPLILSLLGLILVVGVVSSPLIYVPHFAFADNHDKVYVPTDSWPKGAGSGAGFDEHILVAIDSEDNVYVADFYNHRIQKFSSDGDLILEWGQFGNESGSFNRPMGIAIDSEDNVYVA